jgi:hypothetical protein
MLNDKLVELEKEITKTIKAQEDVEGNYDMSL